MGSQAVLATQDGARALLQHLGKVEVGHDEVIMKRLFNSPHPEPIPGDHHASIGDHIKASYVQHLGKEGRGGS